MTKVQIRVLLLIISFLPFNYGFGNRNAVYGQEPPPSNTAGIPVYNFSTLEPRLYTTSDKVYVVNFWAMWCAPCVQELPVFQELKERNPNVEVLLVSLDFPEDLETKLKPFLRARGITLEVAVLDDPDANTWIDKVDPNWLGALPFTIIFNSKNRSFQEGAFESVADLENKLNNTLKTPTKGRTSLY